MNPDRRIPDDPVRFIQERVRRAQIYWTYHVNMRLARRFIARQTILAAVDAYEVIEEYPTDKYLPSYLVLAHADAQSFHVLFAADVDGDNVRVVTAYRPDPREWEPDLKTRRPKT